MNLNVKSNNNNNDATDEFEGPSGKTSMHPPHSPGMLVTNEDTGNSSQSG